MTSGRAGEEPGRYRISDADREHAAQLLPTATAGGRIGSGELDERLAEGCATRWAEDLFRFRS